VWFLSNREKLVNHSRGFDENGEKEANHTRGRVQNGKRRPTTLVVRFKK